MPKKYHISVKPAPLGFTHISKFRILREDACVNCGKCTKVCIYYAHRRSPDDPRKMADPIGSECRNCFRCVQECPRGALSLSITPEFKGLGDEYWKPELILSLWKQADEGKIPVSGAGYKGPFAGPGFDSMWTDMSEIVRPTRDGIHGREYINTSVELGRKLDHLEFDDEGGLISTVPANVEIPLPAIFDAAVHGIGKHYAASIAKAAEKVGTLAIFRAGDIKDADLENKGSHIIPLLRSADIENDLGVVRNPKLVEVEYSGETAERFRAIQSRLAQITKAPLCIRIPMAHGVETRVLELVTNGAGVIHVVADYHGNELNGSHPRFIKDVIRDIHRICVENSVRDHLTLIASGGIAIAEHVPKAIICGADLVAIDIALLLSLGYELRASREKPLVAPKSSRQLSEETAVQRIVNLAGAWHSQLLEVLGAMGMREVRRLRGETGRAMFFEDIDAETFGHIFGKSRK
jgi:ferredoxin